MSLTAFWVEPTATVGVNFCPAPGVQVIRAEPEMFVGPSRAPQLEPLFDVIVVASVPLNTLTELLSESVQPPTVPLTVIVFAPLVGPLFFRAVANVIVPVRVLQVA